MTDELRAKIKNRQENKNCGAGWTIGIIPYSNYRRIEKIKNKIPTEEQHELYKIFCYIRGFDAQSIHSIKNGDTL